VFKCSWSRTDWLVVFAAGLLFLWRLVPGRQAALNVTSGGEKSPSVRTFSDGPWRPDLPSTNRKVGGKSCCVFPYFVFPFSPFCKQPFSAAAAHARTQKLDGPSRVRGRGKTNQRGQPFSLTGVSTNQMPVRPSCRKFISVFCPEVVNLLFVDFYHWEQVIIAKIQPSEFF